MSECICGLSRQKYYYYYYFVIRNKGVEWIEWVEWIGQVERMKLMVCFGSTACHMIGCMEKQKKALQAFPKRWDLPTH